MMIIVITTMIANENRYSPHQQATDEDKIESKGDSRGKHKVKRKIRGRTTQASTVGTEYDSI